MTKTNIQSSGVDFGHIGWKYYNSIIKKAMEQEFSWSGLSLSLSIAFFVVIFSAQALSMTYQYISREEEKHAGAGNEIYRLEGAFFRTNGPVGTAGPWAV